MPLGLMVLLALCLLVFGVMGLAAAVWTRVQVQEAADVATRAAVAEAEPYVRLAVTLHQVSCTAPAGQMPDCVDNPPQTVGVEGWWPELVGDAGGGLPGWAWRAGCTAVGQDPQSDGAVVCTGWKLAAWGWQYPPGTDPAGTARYWLAANTASLTAGGKTTVDMLDVTVADDGTGKVSLRARVVEGWNPLSLVIGGPATITVASAAQPFLAQALPQSGS
jgi:Tfp pilus assembly protein PilV